MRQASRLIILAILASLPAPFAVAGWHSGGGNLFTDAENPWFLENTREIRYCIEIDDANFGQNLAVARTKIQAAFAYWQREFSSVRYPPQMGHPQKDIRLATQVPAEVDCSQAVDVTFQLGTLSDEQARYLQHPEKIVAETVRTEYDPRTLKGKGFVYVSPENGRHALIGPGGRFGGAIMPGRWRYADGTLLELVLVHELGHVFGLQHIDDTLMAADFPSRMVSYPEGYGVVAGMGAPWFLMREDDIFASTYSYELGPDAPSPTNDTTKILALPPDAHGIIELRPSQQGKLDLYNLDSEGRPSRLIGTFYRDGSDDAVFTGLVTLFLTPAQTIFQGIPSTGIAERLYYMAGKERTMSYRPANDGVPKSIAVRTSGPLATFLGVNDRGRINLDFLEMENWMLDWSRIPDHDPAGPATLPRKKSRLELRR